MAKINVTIEEVNEKISNNLDLFINKSEFYYKKQLNSIVDRVKDDFNIKFILLAGPSSAGKTTTGNLLVEKLNKINRRSKLISLDDFFLDRDETPLLQSGERDFDSINSIDWKLFREKINELLTQKKAFLPTYDFKTGAKFYTTTTTTLADNEILIFEGLHALNPLLDGILPKSSRIKVFLNNESNYVSGDATIISNLELRLIRRLIRDMYKRHFPPNLTIKQWKFVRESEEEYIFPYKNTADFIINSSLFYEAGIYSFVLSYLDFEDEYLNNIKQCFMNIKPISPELIPDESLLFEFIVKGKNYKNAPKIAQK